jgi:hypothetical protein
MMEKYIITKLKNEFIFWKNKIIHFVKVETDNNLHNLKDILQLVKVIFTDKNDSLVYLSLLTYLDTVFL